MCGGHLPCTAQFSSRQLWHGLEPVASISRATLHLFVLRLKCVRAPRRLTRRMCVFRTFCAMERGKRAIYADAHQHVANRFSFCLIRLVCRKKANANLQPSCVISDVSDLMSGRAIRMNRRHLVLRKVEFATQLSARQMPILQNALRFQSSFAHIIEQMNAFQWYRLVKHIACGQ